MIYPQAVGGQEKFGMRRVRLFGQHAAIRSRYRFDPATTERAALTTSSVNVTGFFELSSDCKAGQS